jgi:hypothetical protein
VNISCLLSRGWVAALVVAAWPQLASAEMPLTYMDEGRALFRVSAPDFWTIRSGGQRAITPPGLDEARLINRVIGLSPATEDGVWVGFMSPHGVRTYQDALEYLRDIGPFLVKDAKVDERKRTTVGGRAAARITGSGRRDGQTVQFTAVVIDLPGNRVAISIVVMEGDVDPGFVADVNAIFASFRTGG